SAADPTLPEHVYRVVWGRIRNEPAASGKPVVPSNRLADSLGARTALIRGAVARLSPPERALFLFTRIAGLTGVDAARVVGVSETEARRHLVHALDSLRASLGELLELMTNAGRPSSAGAASRA